MNIFKHGLNKLFFMRKGHTIEVQEPGEDNVLSLFRQTLTKKELATSIADLPEDKRYEYIKCYFLVQQEMIPDLTDCAEKCLAIIISRLYQYELKELMISQGFEGTKMNVKSEDFVFHISMKDTTFDLVDKNTQAAMENAKEPNEKINLFAYQSQVVLNLYEQVKEKLGDKTGEDAAFLTSSLLLIFEYLSAYNIENSEMRLEGFENEKIKTKDVFLAQITRNELEFGLLTRIEDPVVRTFRH